MRRVLLDEGVPIGVRSLVVGFPVDSAAELGWAGLANGELIEAAEQAGYDVLITADQNISYQQNMTGRRLALIVLMTSHLDTIRDHGGHPSRGVGGGKLCGDQFPKTPTAAEAMASAVRVNDDGQTRLAAVPLFRDAVPKMRS